MSAQVSAEGGGVAVAVDASTGAADSGVQVDLNAPALPGSDQSSADGQLVDADAGVSPAAAGTGASANAGVAVDIGQTTDVDVSLGISLP